MRRGDIKDCVSGQWAVFSFQFSVVVRHSSYFILHPSAFIPQPMHFANPWGLLALLALPTIIVFHLYHRRFPPLVVAGLHLWTSETRQTIAGRRREKLPVSASLLL